MENTMIKALNALLAFRDGGRSPQHAGSCTRTKDEFQEEDILPCIADLSAPFVSPSINSLVSVVVGFHVMAITLKEDRGAVVKEGDNVNSSIPLPMPSSQFL
ncbi:hypothetical protein ZWY2020_003648 [Hordeum vulgare]|nr:hypothetical protein ZWY2020_003648 [Hordeum vulgare]